ncbi:MAG TPA: response regulator [Azospirillaceae bacterium]|nr:response regulator [Azospirillaceae bacterium]
MTMVVFSKCSALVIEDQSFIRGVVVKILKQLSFGGIMEAEDGTVGLEIALDRRPDVIICDIEMAPMDGLTFLRELRKKEDDRYAIPVMFLTNHADKDTVLKARDLGVNAFVAKPVTVAALREKLTILLQRRLSAV